MTPTTRQIASIGWDEGNRSANRRPQVDAAHPKWTRDDYNAAARKANEVFAAMIGAADASPASIHSRLAELEWQAQQ